VKPSELRDLPLEELRSKEKDTQEALFNLRFQQATGLLENSMRVSTTKKDLARIKTILREKITAQQNR
jgi:large subunit ribosomal protein L29